MAAHLNRAFKSFDFEGTGFVSKSQLKSAMAVLGGDEFPAEMVEEVVAAAEFDKHGKVDYQQFVLKQLRLMAAADAE